MDDGFSARAPDPRLTALLAGFPSETFSDHVYKSVELADCYGLELAVRVASELGLDRALVRWRSLSDLIAEQGFVDFRWPLSWVLERLAVAGLVGRRTVEERTEYRLRHPLRASGHKRLRDIGLKLDARNAATLDLLDAAAGAYSKVARGEGTGEEALLGMQQIGLWLAYFSNDNPLYAVNNWIGAIAAARCLAKGAGELSILELGAGASSATIALLDTMLSERLSDRVVHYRVTEPNAFFRRRGERVAKAAHPGAPLEYSALDIDKPWDRQGIETGRYDLVFAVNVLHVAKDLCSSLRAARAALAPGGWLVAGECLRPLPGQPIWVELIFQILESFRAVDLHPDYRPNPGFLTADQWRRALHAAGFSEVSFAPDVERIQPIYPRFFTGAVCAKKNESPIYDGAGASLR